MIRFTQKAKSIMKKKSKSSSGLSFKTRVKIRARNIITTFRTLGVIIRKNVSAFFLDIYRHWESAAILVFASIGVAHLIGELPFFYNVPWFIEVAMVAPVLAVLIVLGLTWIAKFRMSRRSYKAWA